MSGIVTAAAAGEAARSELPDRPRRKPAGTECRPGTHIRHGRQGIRDDEWRLQRIRPFDWYTVDYKRQAQRELQAKYWRLWSIEVRCYRQAGRPEKAADLLALMDQRAASMHSPSDPAYWDALATLVRLYEEGNRKDLATQKLHSMQDFLAAHPDPNLSAQLENLQKLVNTP